jgi:hypothetical protein
VGRSQNRLAWAKMQNLSKIIIITTTTTTTEAKRTGDMVQVIEFLPSKCKALSSKPSATGTHYKSKFVFYCC